MAVLAFVVAAPPASAQYQPFDCAFIVSPSNVVPGQTVTITGQNFVPNSTVTFNVSGIPFVSATADSSGRLSTTGVIPTSLAAGTYNVTVDCNGVIASQAINVSANNSNNNGNNNNGNSNLANTGADPMPFIKVALALLAVGGLIVLATRRKPRVDSNS